MNILGKNFPQRFQELNNHHRSGHFLSGELSEVAERIWKLSQLWMGLETLEVWDRNAPLPDADEAVIHWDDAQKMVMDAYGAFSPKMAELAGLLIKNGYTRIAYYPTLNFFHVDYKCTFGKQFFISDMRSNWTNVTPEEFYRAIHD